MIFIVIAIFGNEFTNSAHMSNAMHNLDGEKERKMETRVISHSVYSLDLCTEKGASSSVLALPLTPQDFHLHKSAFRNSIHLQYGWNIPDAPSDCT
uniref:Uncharacterized protein n=1 Tax=Amphimedon queenslandica TaxID=400682 RepID=A0A1X7VBT1_AMPQE